MDGVYGEISVRLEHICSILVDSYRGVMTTEQTDTDGLLLGKKYLWEENNVILNQMKYGCEKIVFCCEKRDRKSVV